MRLDVIESSMIDIQKKCRIWLKYNFIQMSTYELFNVTENKSEIGGMDYSLLLTLNNLDLSLIANVSISGKHCLIWRII